MGRILDTRPGTERDGGGINMAFLDETGLAELWTLIKTNDRESLDTALEPFDKVFKYRWRRRTKTGQLTGSGEVSITIEPYGYYFSQAAGNTSYSNSITVYYADDCSVDSESGKISLENPGSTGAIAYGADVSVMNVVKGMYWSTEGTDGLSQVYWTSADADDAISEEKTTLSSAVPGSIAGQTITQFSINTYPLSYQSSTGSWENIWGDTEEAYPHSGISNGCEYDYEGRPYDTLIDGTCELIEWEGTGTYGEENPTVLTFRGAPRMVLIHDAGIPGYHILLRPLAAGRCTATSSDKDFDFIDNAVWNENTLSWYHNQSAFDEYSDTAAYQQQMSGRTYYALALYK